MTKHTRQQVRGHSFRGSREKLRTVYLIQGIMWGSVAWPLFTTVLFLTVTAYVEHQPLQRGTPHA